MSEDVEKAAVRTGVRVSRRLSVGLTVATGVLTVFGPLSLDLYLPVLPAITREFRTSDSIAQVTLSACLVGLAIGQLVAGPLSDRFGRRRVLLIGVAAYATFSGLCAVSPTVESLAAARLVQGVAGGFGMVIAQAAGRDTHAGGGLVRFYGRLAVLSGSAAIVAPLIGGALASIMPWRGVFIVLALLGVGIFLFVAVSFAETLPTSRRVVGGVAHTLRNYRTLVRDWRVVSVVAAVAFANACLYAYLSGATYVLQGQYHFSAAAYSYAFGSGSVAFVICGYLGGALAERRGEARTLTVGVGVILTGATAVLGVGITHANAAAFIGAVVLMVAGIGIMSPAGTALVVSRYPHMAGTAASLLGTSRLALGGITAPLVGAAGTTTALTLGMVMTVAAAIAFAASIAVTQAHRVRRPQSPVEC